MRKRWGDEVAAILGGWAVWVISGFMGIVLGLWFGGWRP